MSFKDYIDTRRRERIYSKWLEQFKQKNGWTVVPSDAVPPVKFTNKDRSYLEVIDFVVNQPKKYFCYVNWVWREIRTWNGDKLGDIAFWDTEYISNFGDVRVYINVQGINGLDYWGWAYTSAGNYARIYAFKDQDD